MKNSLTFIKMILLAVSVFFMFGCDELRNNKSTNNIVNKYAELNEPSIVRININDLGEYREERCLVIFDSLDELSLKTKGNIGIVLSYMKKSFDVMDISKGEKPDFAKYDYIVIAIEDFDKLPQLISIMEKVKEGAGLLIASRPSPYGDVFAAIKGNLGIKETRGFADNAIGIKVLTDILIKAKGFESNSEEFTESAVDVTLDKECCIHMQTTKGIPLLWSKKYAKGNVVFYNGVSIESKTNRGLLAGCITRLKDNFIYPIINVKIFNLDDFPAPIPDGNSEELGNISMSKFIKSIWWPQLISWAKEYNLKYSSYFIQSYDNKVEAPFQKNALKMDEFQLEVAEKLDELLGEQGLHGYNHQPLGLEGFVKYDWGYQPWKSQKDMEIAIGTANDWFNRNFYKYKISSYVAPSNIISNEGRSALKNALPNLRVISGIYIDTYYGQEFGVGKDGIVNLPRVSAGFVYDDISRWADYNSINLYGVYSHFVHPDDVLDKERTKGRNWEWIKADFDKSLKYLRDNFAWLRPMTNSEAAYEIKKYAQIRPYVEYVGNKMVVKNDNFAESGNFILRSDGVISGDGCIVLGIDNGVYLIRAQKSEFSITVEKVEK